MLWVGEEVENKLDLFVWVERSWNCVMMMVIMVQNVDIAVLVSDRVAIPNSVLIEFGFVRT